MKIFHRPDNNHLPVLGIIVVPNMILILLLSFLMLTNMKGNVTKSTVVFSQTNSITKLARKTVATYIYIGQHRMMINDASATVDDIGKYLEKEVSSMSPSDRKKMYVVMKIDQQAPMGAVSDVRHVLQKAGIQNVSFEVIKES
jgi:biopolymer transport protein ExbD